jgi:hypothetical protein
MTQHYIVGELSSLLGDLQPPPGDWSAAVDELRHEVEHSAVPLLPRLAREAMGLTDRVCWDALEHGDVGDFSRYAKTGAALWEFSANAGLLSEGYSA